MNQASLLGGKWPAVSERFISSFIDLILVAVSINRVLTFVPIKHILTIVFAVMFHREHQIKQVALEVLFCSCTDGVHGQTSWVRGQTEGYADRTKANALIS